MPTHVSTTPFGRRMLTYAQIRGQATARTRDPETAVHKWAVFRDICTARPRLNVSERALAVLDALLTFHPETALTGDDLVVFPSNQQLSLRAHGMAPATLRRHLSVLVEAGLIIRRDSPNGKRYARKNARGAIEVAYGFDLSPLVVRAPQFAAWADDIRAEARTAKQFRERITLARRDIAKMIALGQEQRIPLHSTDALAHDWDALHTRYRSILARVPRNAASDTLRPIADELSSLAHKLAILLEEHAEFAGLSTNESQSERHKQSSESDYQLESETAPRTVIENQCGATSSIPIANDPENLLQAQSATESARRLPPHTGRPACTPNPPCEHGQPHRERPHRAAATPMATLNTGPASHRTYSLSLIKTVCPQLCLYTRQGLTSWGDLLDAVAIVRPFLGISPSAWDTARCVMGEIDAAIVVACILERTDAINNPGGYLRNLASRATIGAFSVGPMLAALIKDQTRQDEPSEYMESRSRAQRQKFFRNDDYMKQANRV